MTGDDPRHAPVQRRIWYVTVCLASSCRLPSAPVPEQDGGSASPVDDGYHCQDEPHIGLQGQDAPAAVTCGVDDEQGERDASGNCADRQTAHQACCQAASSCGRKRISAAVLGPGGGWQPRVNARGYFVVDLRKECSTTASRYSGPSSAWTSAAARMSAGASGHVLITGW